MNIEYTIEHGYISNATCEISDLSRNIDLYTADIEIDDKNINPQNSVAMDVLKEKEEWQDRD